MNRQIVDPDPDPDPNPKFRDQVNSSKTSVAGYVFVQSITHQLQLPLDQRPHAFNVIGVCNTVRINKVLGVIH